MSTTSILIKPRPLATYHPDIWGERFLSYIPVDDNFEMQQIEELKKKVQKELKSSTDSPCLLALIDAIQRLAVEYHFEDAIEEALRNVHETFQDGHDLVVFNKFRDDRGKFKESLSSDIEGILSLYEAANLRKPEGDDILEEALDFAITHLRNIISSDPSNPLVPQITHALKQPLLKNLPRMEARRYIPIYADNVSHNKNLLKLAKLDFNLIQSMHKQELCELVRWWKDMELETKLPYARSRIVELYFWACGMHFEPQFRLSRMIVTKVLAVVSVLDDTYDSYGTFEELQLFTAAIQRWSEDCVDQLPDHCLRVCYQLLLDTYDEIEEEMVKQEYQSYRIHYAKRAMKRLVQAYFTETRWLNEAHVPSMEEYMGNACVSSVCFLIPIVSVLGMRDAAVTKETLDWFESDPEIVVALTVIGRLLDDIASHKFEQEREHIDSAVEVYMKEYDVSDKYAIEQLHFLVDKAWKDINEGLILKPVPMSLLSPVLNFARGIAIVYMDGKDGYTESGPWTKEIITLLFVDAVPV